jgi:hypothetical protein
MKFAFCVITTFLLEILAVTNAWDVDIRCCDDPKDFPDCEKRRTLENGFEEESPLWALVDAEPDIHQEDESDVDTSNDEVSRYLRGNEQDQSRRQLDNFRFQLRMHWEEGFCWQAEWKERKVRQNNLREAILSGNRASTLAGLTFDRLSPVVYGMRRLWLRQRRRA